LRRILLKQTIARYQRQLNEQSNEDARDILRGLIAEAEENLAAIEFIWRTTCSHLAWAPLVCGQLETCLERAVIDMDADFGTLQLWDEKQRDLRLVAHRNFDRPFLDTFRVVQVNDDSVCAQALAQRKRLTVADVETDDGFEALRPIMRQAGVRAIQSTPILGPSGDLVGMISTHFSQPHEFLKQEAPVIDFWSNAAGRMITAGRRAN
jgi:hypothetical protein